jgi:hypothetical protein
VEGDGCGIRLESLIKTTTHLSHDAHNLVKIRNGCLKNAIPTCPLLHSAQGLTPLQIVADVWLIYRLFDDLFVLRILVSAERDQRMFVNRQRCGRKRL